VVPATTIASTVYNGFVNDVETDLNQPRPIIAGGTGATNATTALYNVGGEKATQVVTNWDSQVWVPGSFYAAASATGSSPTAGRAFAGTVYIGETLANPPTNQNVVLEARDLDYPTQPGPLYARQKKAGVWSAWTGGGGNAAPFDALAYNGMQINGSMEVSQERGTTAFAGPVGYVCDGWQFSKVGTASVSVGTNPVPGWFTGLLNFVYCTVGTGASLAAGDIFCFLQNIEGYRISRLAWGTANAQPITIAFWTSHHRTGVYSGVVRNGAGNRCYAFTYTHNTADVAQYNVVTIPGDTAGTWAADNTLGMVITFAIAAPVGGTYTAPTLNSWLAGNYFAGIGQINAVAATSDAFRITGVVVLPGVEAPSAARSPYIMRPFDQEITTCRRYYFKSYPYGILPGTVLSAGFNTVFLAGAPSGTYCSGHIIFPTLMRASPSVTMYDYAGHANAASYYAATWQPSGAVSVVNTGGTGLGFTALTNGTANMYNFDLVADARL
jgi:hypothetical protein